MREWIDKIPSVEGGTIPIEKRDLGIRIGKVDTSRPSVAVGHTMEVGHIDISWGNGAAHFALGPHVNTKKPVLQQTIPLGYVATALANPAGGVETNRWVKLQVEMAGFSSLEPWLPPEPYQVLYASLMEFADKELGIPQTRPFPDVLQSGVTWATESNPRRKSGKWGKTAGWFKHAEVQENHHWDDGSMRHRVLLRMEPKPIMVTAFQVMATWRTSGDDPHRERAVLSPHFEHLKDVEDWMAIDEVNIRTKVWRHLKAGHMIYVAEREVDRDAVRV